MRTQVLWHAPTTHSRGCPGKDGRCKRRQRFASSVAVYASAGGGEASYTQKVQELQENFGIAESVKFEQGRGGLPVAVLTHEDGFSATLSLFGANVLSWVENTGDEVLFVREDAKFDKSKPISGGIPVCFPQFGAGPLPQHGFARECDWTVVRTRADPNPDEREPTVALQLSSNSYTKQHWDADFTATLEVSLLPGKLQVSLAVRNDGDSDISFTAGLHSYIEVVSTAEDTVGVANLHDCTYIDKQDEMQQKTETQELITFEDAQTTDRIYQSGEGSTAELLVGTGAAVQVYNRSGWFDHVVWSPDTSVANNTKFVCLESAAASSPVSVPASREWVGTMQMAIADLPPPEG